MNIAQAIFPSPCILLAGILVQYTSFMSIHDNPGHPAVIQCGLCSKRGLGKALWGLWIRLVHSAWVGLGKGSQRMQGSLPGGRTLEIFQNLQSQNLSNTSFYLILPTTLKRVSFGFTLRMRTPRLRRSFSVKGKGRGRSRSQVYLTPAPEHSAFLRASLPESPSSVLVSRAAVLTRIQALAGCCG